MHIHILVADLRIHDLKSKTKNNNNNKERKLGHLKQQHLICESRGNKKIKRKN
jgi:hypothetical protein